MTIILEQEKRLSECLLWRLQESFYEGAGLLAWDLIPNYPTSNPFIGDIYAELIVSFLLDYQAQLNLEKPLYIIELAAGTGAFSFYLLQALLAKKAAFPTLDRLKLRYVMTDFTENIVSGWETYEKLQPFLAPGILDFAVYRPEVDATLTLRRSQDTISPDMKGNPVIAIANYLFDTIRQDQFRVDAGTLQETRFTFSLPGPEVPADPTDYLAQLQQQETHHSISLPYYADPVLDDLLQEYQQTLETGTIIFPLGAFRCIQNLQKLSQNRLVLLSSDKGFSTADLMQKHSAHQYVTHGGAFSYMVNYHALGRYFEKQGGLKLVSSADHHIIETFMGALLPEPFPALAHSRYQFHEKLVRQNLANDLYNCQSFIFTQSAPAPVTIFNRMLSILRLYHSDPNLFCGAAEQLFTLIPSLTVAQRQQLRELLAQIHAQVFSVNPRNNAYFWLGKLYFGLACFPEAIACLEASLQQLGPEEACSLFQLAACYEAQGSFPQALAFYQRAKKLLPDCPHTQAGLERMQEKVS